MRNWDKYAPGYFAPPVGAPRWVTRERIEAPPVWCSVDLRDGNQSLVVPMSLGQKLEYFKFLVKLGFREIEVGFPAASATEFELLRALIDGGLVPQDVTLQVLTQCREHVARRTFEALRGAKNAIVHFYNSTSMAQRRQVFKKSRAEVLRMAVEGARLVKRLAGGYDGNFRFEYSPESFTGTEPEYALEVCNAVLDELAPTPESPAVINLPVTVQLSLPHVYANQIEYMSEGLARRGSVVLCTHPHNDRGCAVADAELALLAGAQRVEGTLFGNGERTGNADIVTLALNLYSHGVDPGLDFSDLPAAVEAYESATGMEVGPRHPYAGELVFAAFSGGHQDAIAKALKWRQQRGARAWSVPYLPVDPQDLGRRYETSVIRINSQSGKGGIGHLLERHYGYTLPPKMREALGYAVKEVSDRGQCEVSALRVHDIFVNTYLNVKEPLDIPDAHFSQRGGIVADVTVLQSGEARQFTAEGNGRLDAVTNALREATRQEFTIAAYAEHALETGSSSDAVAYVGLDWGGGGTSWGAGRHTDIIMASVAALVSAYNNGCDAENAAENAK